MMVLDVVTSTGALSGTLLLHSGDNAMDALVATVFAFCVVAAGSLGLWVGFALPWRLA